MYRQRCLAVTWQVPREAAAVSARSVSVHHITMHIHVIHFTQSLTRRVHACLAVTCHLLFSQNDRDLLRATGVTRGWNGHRNKSAHKADPGE